MRMLDKIRIFMVMFIMLDVFRILMIILIIKY